MVQKEYEELKHTISSFFKSNFDSKSLTMGSIMEKNR